MIAPYRMGTPEKHPRKKKKKKARQFKKDRGHLDNHNIKTPHNLGSLARQSKKVSGAQNGGVEGGYRAN